MNCNAMCAGCNRRHNEDATPYLRFMQERYGPGAVAELEGLKTSRQKVTEEDLLRALEQLRTLT